MEFARVRSLQAETISVAAVVDEARQLVEPMAARRGVTLAFQEPDQKWVALIDADQFVQVMTNLLVNAMQACEDVGGGTVTMAVGIVERIHADDNSEELRSYVAVEVSDDVIELVLPALRERGRDILILAQQFIEEFSELTEREVVGLSAEAGRALMDYEWPGNVRELRNYMERAVVLALQEEISTEDLPAKVRGAGRHGAAPAGGAAQMLSLQALLREGELPTVAELEARYIAFVLGQTEGNKSRAADLLGFDRTTLYRKLERYGIDVQRAVEGA